MTLRRVLIFACFLGTARCGVGDDKKANAYVGKSFYGESSSSGMGRGSEPQLQTGDHMTCPDHWSWCSPGHTCCLMKDDTWGCCNLRQAVCCPDRVHCCPSGHYCNMHDRRCEQDQGAKTWQVATAVEWTEIFPSQHF